MFFLADLIGEVAPFGPFLSLVAQAYTVLDLHDSQHLEVQAAVPEHGWDRIDTRRIVHAEDPLERNVTKDAYLLSYLLAYRTFCAAGDNVRLNTHLHKLLYAELGGFGFLLA